MNRWNVLVITMLVAVGIVVWAWFFRGDSFLPSGKTTRETIQATDQTTREVFVTGGKRHSIPLDEMRRGCPFKDCIPSIDTPNFVSVQAAEEILEDAEPGIAISRSGVDRFYPFSILVRHEIVNDTLGGERVLISYCPLCLTAVVFDPLVNGERVEFGVSGFLWKSNLMMYDRKTESLWSQVLGESVVGEMTGTQLTVLPSDQLRFGEWKKQFPGGKVLSRNSGTFSDYGASPYGDYFEATGSSLGFYNPTDNRLPDNAFVLGIVRNGKAKGYSFDAVKREGVVNDIFEGDEIVARYDSTFDIVRIFVKVDGEEVRINPITGFWFSWVAAHPETELYK